MPSQYAVDHPTLRSQLASLPLYRDPGGMLSRPGGLLRRNNQPPEIWNSQGFSGNVFVQTHERLLRHFIQEDSILGFLT